MNKLEAIFSQKIIYKKNPLEIGFIRSEETRINYGELNLKYWLGWYLKHWNELRSLQYQPTFNLIEPIKIIVKWNDKVVETFMQARVSEKFARAIKKEPVIPLKDSLYVLRDYVEFIRTVNKPPKKIESPKTLSQNLNFYLNSIEYYYIEGPKYGTPILYTGMTN